MSRNPARESVFKAWLDAYPGIISKVTRSFARSSEDAAELRQEIELHLWDSVAAFSGAAKESTWIYRVCLNTALAWRRGTDRRKATFELGVNLGNMAGDTASPADLADRRDLLEQVYEAIRAMDAFDRALVLLMLDGLAYSEIAEVTGLTENHVGVALTRARQRLAKLMKGVIDEME